MVYFSKAALLPMSALAAALSLVGQPVAQSQASPPAKLLEPPSVQRADPADPMAATPALVYRSSLGRYQAFTEPDVAPWRETNDLVRQRGGWRAYAREAREPASTTTTTTTTTPAPAAPAASQPAAIVKPAVPDHAGHGMK